MEMRLPSPSRSPISELHFTAKMQCYGPCSRHHFLWKQRCAGQGPPGPEGAQIPGHAVWFSQGGHHGTLGSQEGCPRKEGQTSTREPGEGEPTPMKRDKRGMNWKKRSVKREKSNGGHGDRGQGLTSSPRVFLISRLVGSSPEGHPCHSGSSGVPLISHLLTWPQRTRLET